MAIFTLPIHLYGLLQRYDDPRRELDHCGVYRLGRRWQTDVIDHRPGTPRMASALCLMRKRCTWPSPIRKRRYGWPFPSKRMVRWVRASCSTIDEVWSAMLIPVYPMAWRSMFAEMFGRPDRAVFGSSLLRASCWARSSLDNAPATASLAKMARRSSSQPTATCAASTPRPRVKPLESNGSADLRREPIIMMALDEVLDARQIDATDRRDRVSTREG